MPVQRRLPDYGISSDERLGEMNTNGRGGNNRIINLSITVSRVSTNIYNNVMRSNELFQMNNKSII